MFTFREVRYVEIMDTQEPYNSSCNVNANVENHKILLL